MAVKISYYAAPTLAAVAMLWAGAALAHHSFALFDMTKPVSITGTVKQWEWTNPHVWIHIIATKPDGTHEEWGLACSSVTNLTRSGWKSSDIKVGEKITVAMYPSRDGRPFGSVATVLLSDGRVLANPMGGRPSGAQVAANPRAPAPRASR